MALNIRSSLQTPELEEFRREVSGFFAQAVPDDVRRNVAMERMILPHDNQQRWQKILYERGWACPGFEKEHGGPGFSLEQRYIFIQEAAKADAPRPLVFGELMLGPILIKYGTKEQKDRFLPGILDGSTMWCQGFSEPNAGSDLAALQCKAERQGDRYIINGSKIWTTEAHVADWMFGLFRTATGKKRQEGISFLLLDMRSPGISITPIPTYDGTGREINQVFFSNVEVPVDQLVGTENEGWSIAKDLLTLERLDASEVSRSMESLRRLRSLLKRAPYGSGFLIDEPVIAERLTAIEAELSALASTEIKLIFAQPDGVEAGPEAALLKLKGTEIQNAIAEFTFDVLGPLSMIDAGDLDGENLVPQAPEEARYLARSYFNARKTMIYGGSNEIQKNIISKAVLGL